MQRINTPTAAMDLFGPGKHGFKDGDTQNGDPPTRLNAPWFNDHQENGCYAVEASGQSLIPGDRTQLWIAMQWAARDEIANTTIDAGTLDGFDSGHFATAADLSAHVHDRNNPHGVSLAQLGGASIDSPDFRGNPRAPTPPANDNDDSIATTAFTHAALVAALQSLGLSGGYAQSLTPTGWSKEPNGRIEQWGRVLGGGGEGIGPTVTFPIAFPNEVHSVVAMDLNASGVARDHVDCWTQVMDASTTRFTTFIQWDGSQNNYWEGFFWRATGR